MDRQAAKPSRANQRAVFKTAALWLLFLGPFFYASYGLANWLAARHAHVPSLLFAWERHIPFVAWTILPYWSLNVFYTLSLFINDTPLHVSRLAKRYLTAQVIAVLCFITFPLQVTFLRPETQGLAGAMFGLLGGFDKPFNQAPSLHIALAILVWDHLRTRFSGPWRWAWHLWCLLIAFSVLTTWQHHSMDMPTGALLGLFALWLFPKDRVCPLAGFRLTRDRKSRRLAGWYLLGALALLIGAYHITTLSGAGLFLLWPSVCLFLVAVAYTGGGPEIFQKTANGDVSLASKWLFMPYRLCVRLNIVFWTSSLPASVSIASNVDLGRFPSASQARRYAAVLDVTAELPGLPHSGVDWRAVPMLDLVPMNPQQLRQAADKLETLRRQGPVLVCCALGFQRSASVVACWLLQTGQAKTMADAQTVLQASGRRVHLPASSAETIIEAAR